MDNYNDIASPAQQNVIEFFKSLAAMRRSGMLCDVLLQSQAESASSGHRQRGVWAHSVVLSAVSPFFYNMLHGSVRECSQLTIRLRGVKTETLLMLVENIYFPTSLSVSVEQGKAILAAADRLSVEDVRDEAAATLQRSLAVDNVLGILVTAQSHNCRPLAAAAASFIRQHGERVLQQDELLSLQPTTLGELLTDGLLAAASAQSALDAVLRWTMFRLQERRPHLSSLVSCVRLSDVPRPRLIAAVKAEPVTNDFRALLLISRAAFVEPFDKQPRNDTAQRQRKKTSSNHQLEHQQSVQPRSNKAQEEVAREFNQDRVNALQEELIHIRKKTFTRWINSFLEKDRMEVKDLFVDLADGRQLHKLLEIISGERPSPLNSGQMTVHKIENINRCINFLRTKARLESINAEDIVDGNPRLILDLIWIIIERFQIQVIKIRVDEENASSEMKSSKDALFLWCKRKTSGYDGVYITNFTDSWRSGFGFNALIHAHRPDLFRWTELPTTNHEDTLNYAFDIAHTRLAIPRLLDAEDVDISLPDEKSIMTYLACYYHTFISTKNETAQRSGHSVYSLPTEVKSKPAIEEKEEDWVYESRLVPKEPVEKLEHRTVMEDSCVRQLPTKVEFVPAIDEEKWVNESRLVPTEVWEEEPVERLEHRTVSEERSVPQVKALYAFSGQGISISEGEVMFLINKTNPDWWSVRKADRTDGFVPANYVKEIEPRIVPVKVRRPEKVRTVVPVRPSTSTKQADERPTSVSARAEPRADLHDYKCYTHSAIDTRPRDYHTTMAQLQPSGYREAEEQCTDKVHSEDYDTKRYEMTTSKTKNEDNDAKRYEMTTNKTKNEDNDAKRYEMTTSKTKNEDYDAKRYEMTTSKTKNEDYDAKRYEMTTSKTKNEDYDAKRYEMTTSKTKNEDYDDKNYEMLRIKFLQDSLVNAQKKFYTKWANSYLRKHRMEIDDLFVDLANGEKLGKLLEIFSGERVPLERGRMRFHKLQNINTCISFLNFKETHLESIGAEDIVDGNPRLILGLIWTIIQRFHLQTIEINVYEKNGSAKKMFAKEALLLWCQQKTSGYHGVKIENFSNSWSSGLGFNALIHAHRPNLFRWADVPTTNHTVTLNHAFDVAFKHLDIPRLLDVEDLDTYRRDEKFIMTYLAFYYHVLHEPEDKTIEQPRSNNASTSTDRSSASVESSPRCAPRALLVLGGYSSRRRSTAATVTTAALIYDQAARRWSSAEEPLAARDAPAIATLDTRVYLIGGGHRSCSVAVYEAPRGSWAAGPALGAARCGAGAAALGGRLYVVGGKDSAGRALCSAEALDPREGEWRPVADMCTPREGVGVAALDGLLYAVGGTNRKNGPLNTVERYEPSTGRWEPSKRMSTWRAYAAVAALDGALYAAGGYKYQDVMSSVEVYRADGDWRYVTPLHTERSHAAAATLGGQLVVAGGLDNRERGLTTLEVWSPATASWSTLPEMPETRHNAAAVVIPYTT